MAADKLPEGVIDLSDFLYWPVFHQEPMVDFSIRSRGMAPRDAPASAKCNRWLSHLRLPILLAPWCRCSYLLFCSRASAPLCAVPSALVQTRVDRIWQAYGLAACGFRPIHLAPYNDVSPYSHTLDHYLAWVRGAMAVTGVDSYSIHRAAGFDLPTLAFFMRIDPARGVRDYPECQGIDARSELTQGLHQNDDPVVLGKGRGSGSPLRHAPTCRGRALA